jgi:hypothetical protein
MAVCAYSFYSVDRLQIETIVEPHLCKPKCAVLKISVAVDTTGPRSVVLLQYGHSCE